MTIRKSLPQHKRHAEQRNAVSGRKNQRRPTRPPERLPDMIMKKLVISTEDRILQSQCGNSPESPDRLSRKLGALRKHLIVHLLKLSLVAYLEERSTNDKRHG